MGMWTEGQNDRDHATEVYGDHRGQHQKRVPCHECRRPVWIEARHDSIFLQHYCSDVCRRIAEAQ